MKIAKRIVFGALMVSLSLALLALPFAAQAQQSTQPAQVSPITMTLYPVQRGTDGKQYITTKAGYKVVIPGLGIAPNAQQVAAFRDAANNYWYINAKNQPTKLTAEQLQWTVDQMNLQAEAQNSALRQQIAAQGGGGVPPQSGYVQQGGGYPQQGGGGYPQQGGGGFNPQQAALQQQAIQQQAQQQALQQQAMQQQAQQQALQQQQQALQDQQMSMQQQQAAAEQQDQDDSSGKKKRGHGVASAVTSAAGAFAGAAVGSTLNNGYYGIPYGTPCYRQGNQVYYNGPGGRVAVAPNSYNNAYINQWNGQNSWQDNHEDRQNNRKDKRDNLNQNQKAARYNAATVRRQNNQAAGGRAAARGGGGGRRGR